jgi:arabinofuranan 3-O-arabinosyltransferase
VLSVALATGWWLLPLVYQGRYGIDFLSFTERADTTTAFTPPFEVLRGVADWLSYYPGREPLIVAGRIEIDGALVILGGAVVVAVGLFGIGRQRTERTFLVMTLLTGTVLVGVGYGGALGNPAAHHVVGLLDGALGALRNVHKFAPVVLLPIVIGVASGYDELAAAVARRRRNTGPVASRAVPAVLVVAIVAAGWPLFAGDLLHRRGFSEVPSWWEEAKAYVEDAPARTLILPGLPLSSSSWGFTAEEPLEWGTDAEWAVRQIAPLGSSGATKVLDTIESVIEEGGSPKLPAYLRRAGFSTVLVRNDGDWRNARAPSPQQTTSAMQASGFELVASFGPPIPLTSAFGPSVTVAHPIDIYEVPDAASMRPVSTTTVDSTAVVSGDAGTPLSLVGTTLENRAVQLAADREDGDPLPPRWLVTDDNQRRFTNFGLTRLNDSYVLTADEPAPGGGDVSAGFLPDERAGDQTVAVRSGVTAVTASSYGSWLVSVPESGPQQAIDSDPSTAWAAAPELDQEQQWIRLRLDRPREVDEVEVQLLADGPWRPQVTALEVSTETGSVVSNVAPGEDRQTVAAPGGETSWLQVRLAGVDAADGSAGAGIREIEVPGVTVDQRLAVPDQLDEAYAAGDGQPPSYRFARSTVDSRSILRSDEETDLSRAWYMPRGADMSASVVVTAVPDPSWSGVLDGPLALQAAVSSTYRGAPEFGAGNLVDGEPGTWWIAADVPDAIVGGERAADSGASVGLDREPTVVLEWAVPTSVDSLRLGLVATASSPASVRVVTETGEVREAEVDADGLVTFDAVTARRLEVTFPEVSPLDYVGDDGDTWRLPLALSSLTVPVAHQNGTMDATTRVAIPCGSGPELSIDGEARQLSIATTVGAVARLDPIPARVCGGADLNLSAGEHTIDTGRGDGGWQFAALSVRLDPVGATVPPVAESRTVGIERWNSDRREVRVGAGELAYLVVDENANDGWKATLEGEELRPVVLDGWKQGFVVPAGRGGLVTLAYAPTSDYRRALVIGGLLALALIPMALGRSRRVAPPATRSGRAWPPLAVGAVLLAGVALGGPLVLLAVPLLLLRRSRPSWLPVVAGAAFVVAGLAVAWSPTFSDGGAFGAFGWIATVASVLAVLAVGCTIVDRPAPAPPPDHGPALPMGRAPARPLPPANPSSTDPNQSLPTSEDTP